MSDARTFAFLDGKLHKKNFPVSEISNLIKQDNITIAVDFSSPSEEDIIDLANELDLHELAVEDALHAHQRPKIDYYPDHLFLACHALTLDSDTGILSTTELDTFVLTNCIITIYRDKYPSQEYYARYTKATGPIDVSYLLHILLDSIIDQYLETITRFDDYFDEVSETIFSGEYIDITREKKWFNMRKSLVQFHRVMISMREAINVLLRRDNQLISGDLLPYYYDLNDHILRVSETTNILRELVVSIVETNINIRDYHQNQIVKKVTSWAAIIAVPTLVTGYYGMNVPFPGSGQTSGAIISTGLALCASFILYRLFRRKDWL